MSLLFLNAIISDYNQELRVSWLPGSHLTQRPVVDVAATNWYNPTLSYQLFMVPGILAILVTMIGGYLSALNIVKEKEAECLGYH